MTDKRDGKNKALVELADTKRKLRNAEGRLRSLINGMPVGLAMVTEAGAVLALNPRALEIFGYESFEALEEHTIHKLLEGDAFEKLTSEASESGTIECFGIGRNAEKIPVEVSLSDFDADEGQLCLLTIQDISDRHQLDQMKKEFSAMIAHDLRAPLSAILVNMAALAEGIYGPVTNESKVCIARAQDSADRLMGLINQLLDIERIEAGVMKLDLETVNLTELIKTATKTVDALAEKKGITLSVQPVSTSIVADSGRVVQVLVNLLSNAIKFSPDGGTVEVSASELDNFVEVCIADQGRGISNHLQHKIFDRFKQVDSEDEKVRGGSGLGLAISKAIVEAHDGSIGVDSALGNGSVFWFRLPKNSTNVKRTSRK